MERAGAAGVHMEDQAAAKRCGHRPVRTIKVALCGSNANSSATGLQGKQIVSKEEMVDRIKAAVDAR